jgi:ribosomal protein L6P/L9E
MRNTYSLKKFSTFNILLYKGLIKITGPVSNQNISIQPLGFIINETKVFFKHKAEMYLFRALVLNGIAKTLQVGFKKLTLKGIGFKCYKLTDNIILLKVGYTHKIYCIIENADINIVCKKGRMVLYSNNIDKLSNLVYNIKNFRIPDSYKGKGIIFTDQVLKLKSSKKRV